MQKKDKEEEKLLRLIHYFQDNQKYLRSESDFSHPEEKFEIIQKQSCHPNSSCMWPLAVTKKTKWNPGVLQENKL